MRSSVVSLISPLVCSFFCLVLVAVVAQPTSSPTTDPCSSVTNYGQSHSNCYVYHTCYGIVCYTNSTYTDIYINPCEDPPTVEVYSEYYNEDFSSYHVFQYLYNQSETVDNDGIYSYGDTGRYTGITARNASHLGFQLTVERNETVETLLETLYFYLEPATCLCDSMQYVAEDMYLLSDYSCNTTHDSNCTEIFCQVEGNTLESVTYDLYQCTSPNPTFELSMVLSGQTYSLNVTDNTTRTITTDGLVLNVIINVWYFNYSMDLQISVLSGDYIQEILSRHKIILDLTTCDIDEPFDLSTAPPPTTEFTEPTPSSTTDSTYDTCAALQSISVADGNLCITNVACTALECEIAEQRMEIAILQCHDPPGVNIILYSGRGQVVYNRTFYNGSTIVNSTGLPIDLNVTVEQLSSEAIALEVEGSVRSTTLPLPFPTHLTLVPRTVIPIDKASCATLVPPTTAPTSTCTSMQYIASALSVASVDACFFPVPGNCTTVTCPMTGGLDLTISLLRCRHPPAIRVTYGNPFLTVFDHTFDHSEYVSNPLDPTVGFNVTLDQLCPSDIGFQLEVVTDGQSYVVVPYTVIPINTTDCGAGTGITCPSSSSTVTSTHSTTTTTRPHTTTTTATRPHTTTTTATRPHSTTTTATRPHTTTTTATRPHTTTTTHPHTTTTTRPHSTTTTTRPHSTTTSHPNSTSPPPPPPSQTETQPTPTSTPTPSVHTSATPTAPPTSPPDHNICDAMNNVSEMLNKTYDNCSVTKDCRRVDCKWIDGTEVSFILSCSPIGMKIQYLNSSADPPINASKLYTESGYYENTNVTVDHKTNAGFRFALFYEPEELYIVNFTFIPTVLCASPTADTSHHHSSNAAIIGAAVGVPVVLLLVLVTVIVVITAVYLIKRRRYRHYQLHRMAMSDVIDDEEPA